MMVINGDALTELRKFPDEIVDCCITSPPYYALRNYGVDGQIGLEDTPQEYIEKLTEVFHEVKRVLKPQGTLWLNVGDSYCNSNGFSKASKDYHREGSDNAGLKAKDLIGIPWMLAFSLRADGWYLRQDIIWHKPNPMPESVTDRCTRSHEYVFLLSKSQKYYFDYEAIQEDAKCIDDRRKDAGRIEYDGKRAEGADTLAQRSFVTITDKRNKRDVWSITVKAIKEAHFATFPEQLVEPCILAGCPVNGVVLAPFFGSGTTGRVAKRLNRDYIGIELNPDYVEIINRRTDNIQMTMTGLID